MDIVFPMDAFELMRCTTEEDTEIPFSIAKMIKVARSLLGDCHVIEPEPIFIDDFLEVHNKEHITDIFRGRKRNGFGNTEPTINAFVGMSNAIIVRAVENVLEYHKPVVFAPASGFHHAGYDFCGGYCTLNGICIAISNARSKDLLKYDANILILDGDAHYGDGTADILARTRWPMNITHLTASEPFSRYWPGNKKIIESALNTRYDLVIYQAGADAHVEDPLYDGYLTDEEFEERDRLVFELCRKTESPVVFNLAGGYNGQKTIDLHLGTVRVAKEVFGC